MSIFDRRRRGIPSQHRRQHEEEPRVGPMLSWDFGDDLIGPIGSAPATPVIEGVLAPVSERVPVKKSSNRRQARFAGGQPDAQLTDAFRGQEASVRVIALGAALDEALDQWWRANQLPPPALLRDGLLALEADQALDEGHRTLLLRAALAHRRGMVTALRHQTDPERTASILKEALLDIRWPLAPDLLWRLRQEDEQSHTWEPLLVRDLKDELRSGHGLQQQMAEQTLSIVQGKRPPVHEELRLVGAAHQEPEPAAQYRSYWSPGRLLILVLFVVAILIGAGMYWARSPKMGVVSIPAGKYIIGDAEESGGERTVQLAAFAMDQSEVTNQQYGQCVAAGQCPPPASAASAKRPDYVANPAYALYPAVHVDWEGARRYCDRLAKRLPTADEWEVAASVAPAIQHHYRYPWGETFDRRLANTQASGHEDTKAVGSYHPAGDSPFGLVDMAGNVAEWTSTSAPGDRDGNNDSYIVKGGSFRDAPANARTHGQQYLERQTTADWLGFRCVADLPR